MSMRHYRRPERVGLSMEQFDNNDLTKKLLANIQSTLDLMTLSLVTNLESVTFLQLTSFLVNRISRFSYNLTNFEPMI